MLHRNLPGGRGSVPALVMRTGLIQPVDPRNARADTNQQHVLDVTRWPAAESPDPMFMPGPLSPTAVTPLLPAPPSPTTTAVAQTVSAVPPMPVTSAPSTSMPHKASDRHHWHHQFARQHPMVNAIRELHPRAMLHGPENVSLGEWNGRPLAQFQVTAAPTSAAAHSAVAALRQAALTLRATGLTTLPPELIGGPLAALMRGGAVELRFQNGVVMKATL